MIIKVPNRREWFRNNIKIAGMPGRPRVAPGRGQLWRGHLRLPLQWPRLRRVSLKCTNTFLSITGWHITLFQTSRLLCCKSCALVEGPYTKMQLQISVNGRFGTTCVTRYVHEMSKEAVAWLREHNDPSAVADMISRNLTIALNDASVLSCQENWISKNN